MSSGQKEAINLDTLEPQQLAQVKKQLEEELEHLTNSFSQLHGAQNKFRECLRCVQSRAADSKEEKEVADMEMVLKAAMQTGSKAVLVPLTNSLYVSGELTSTETVLVDVGTGFMIEKNLKSAEKFYNSKVKELGDNLKELEGIVQSKQMNVRTIEEVLRQKIIAAQSEGQS
ncbi:Prefoldin [Trichoderma sp. TUCIM 5745]